MSETIMVPLHLLSITSTNARRDHVADKAMIASLKSQGLLYPLLIKGIDGSRSYDVIDGARRLSCILKGLEDGELDVDQFEIVPCPDATAMPAARAGAEPARQPAPGHAPARRVRGDPALGRGRGGQGGDRAALRPGRTRGICGWP